MTSRQRSGFCTLALAAVILFHQSTSAGDGLVSTTAGAKPIKLTVAFHAGGAEGDLKALREAVEKVPGVKFTEELKFSDFGKDGGKFTSFTTIEIADFTKSDVGAIGKAVAAASTSKKEKCPPELYLIIRYRPGSTKNEPLRASLAKTKGAQPAKSWAGDANIWISVDGSGAARLAEITSALRDAGAKFRDPITDAD